MPRIYSLKINNYRSIKTFEEVFGDINCVCIVGRGDSGKTTILEAIKAVLSPAWNLSFSDMDFFELDVNNPIVVEAVVFNLPKELRKINKYGTHCQVIRDGVLSANIALDDQGTSPEQLALKVRLYVDETLEPQWSVVSDRPNLEDIPISARDRSLLNMLMVSDTSDSHFTFRKGSPLFSLVYNKLGDEYSDFNAVTTSIMRSAYNELQKTPLSVFNHCLSDLSNEIKAIGLDLQNLQAKFEYNPYAYNENGIALHNDMIPFRLYGKGAKRLLSVALQNSTEDSGGIILVDEVEQGLEPDRAKNLTQALIESIGMGQVFMTTHSRDVVVEPAPEQVFLMRSGANFLLKFPKEIHKIIELQPEGIFAKKIICCEGKTEVGIIRALDKKNNRRFASKGIVPIDCGGNDLFYLRALQFKSAGYETLVFCDNDNENRKILERKSEAENADIPISICEKGNSIEQQIFNDLPWEGVLQLIDYLEDNDCNVNWPINGYENFDEIRNASIDSQQDIRRILGDQAKSKLAWFKEIEGGECLGKVWFDSLEEMNRDKSLYYQYQTIMDWVNNGY